MLRQTILKTARCQRQQSTFNILQIKKLARRNNPESEGAASCRVNSRQRSIKKAKDGKGKCAEKPVVYTDSTHTHTHTFGEDRRG